MVWFLRGNRGVAMFFGDVQREIPLVYPGTCLGCVLCMARLAWIHTLLRHGDLSSITYTLVPR